MTRRTEPVVVTPHTLREWPLPEPGSDKKSRGTLLVVGGSSTTPGAVVLAGEAAYRVGAGKVRLATAGSVAAAVAAAVPEAAVLPVGETSEGALDPAKAPALRGTTEQAAVVLVGPGFTDTSSSVQVVAGLLPAVRGVLVVDALASAYVTEHPRGVQAVSGGAVLTLNPTELARTLDRDDAEVADDQAASTADLARSSGAVVLCGGTEKTVATPDGRCWTIRVGGPGLGASGSGDVQAGVVAGLAARGAEPAQAAVWGAYLHGRAGDRLAVSLGAIGFLARELPAQLPAILSEVTG